VEDQERCLSQAEGRHELFNLAGRTVPAAVSTRTDGVKQRKERQRETMRRNLTIPHFERFGQAWAPTPRDNPPKYVWLRLKPEPRLTPHRDD
jgi:hypothetical protein